MKAFSLIGIVVCVGGLFLGATMEGSNVMAVLSPSAMSIVLVGTLGASMAGSSFESIKAIPMCFKAALIAEPTDMNGRLQELVSRAETARRARLQELVAYAEKTRRDGLLALDEQVGSIEACFTPKLL